MSQSFLLITLVLVVIVGTLAEDKLQIGVKKKVENCDRKSRKGDRLHMHYTVSYGKLSHPTDEYLSSRVL